MKGEMPEKREERYLEKIKVLDMVWRLNEQVMSFRSMDDLLESILKAALEVMEATSGSIMVVDPPGSDTMTIRASRGLRREVVKSTRIKLGEGIAGMVAERREGMLLLDDLMDPRLRTRRKITDALSVPIVDGGELIGVLNLNTKKEQAFGEFDLFLLNTIIKQIASAIERGLRMENIRLHVAEMEEEEKRIMEEMQRLNLELERRRRDYQRLRQAHDRLLRDMQALSGPVG